MKYIGKMVAILDSDGDRLSFYGVVRSYNYEKQAYEIDWVETKLNEYIETPYLFYKESDIKFLITNMNAYRLANNL